jgi:germacradienol/geosmin synthase
MPFASRSHPEVDAVRRHAAAWAMDLGMLAGDVWTSDWFYGRDFGLFSAVTYPDAELAELELINDWHVWLWYVEDLFAEVFQRTENLPGAKAFGASLRGILDDPAPVPGNPAERGLADLCRRSDVDTQLVRSAIDQIVDRVRRRQPDPVELLESRRAAGAFSAQLIRSLDGAPPVRELENTFADIATLNRDLYAYPHEIGSRHNIVLAVQRFLDGNLTEAIKVVSDLSSSRLGRFEHLAASEPPGDPTTASYVDRMRDWLAGHLLWHQVRIPAVMGGVRDRVVG